MELLRIAVIFTCVLAVIAEITFNIGGTSASTTNRVTDTNEEDSELAFKLLEDKLYEDILNSKYDKAIEQVKSMVDQGQNEIIKSAVQKLVKNKKSQATVFAYKLWASGDEEVVKNTVPSRLRIVFENDKSVAFTDSLYALPLMVAPGNKTNDRAVFGNDGDVNYEGYFWKIEPVYHKDDIYFKIRNNVDGRYLKLVDETNSNGEHLAYASIDSDTDKHLWLFQPVELHGVSFFIVNYHYKQALKLGDQLHEENRSVSGIGGDFASYPEKYAWSLLVVIDKKLNLVQ